LQAVGLACLVIGTLSLQACGGDESSGAPATAAQSSVGSTSTASIGSSVAPASVSSASVSGPANNQSTTAAALIIKGTPAAIAVAGSRYTFQPTVSTTSTPVTYTISGIPQWATFNTNTGVLTGTPSATNEGSTSVIAITASTGNSSASMTPFSIRVTAPAGNTGTATITWVAPTENTDGTPITDLSGFHIYYGTNPSELNMQASVPGGTSTSYVIAGLGQDTYYFAVVAYTSAGEESIKSGIVDSPI
jgi:hypothetical protein